MMWALWLWAYFVLCESIDTDNIVKSPKEQVLARMKRQMTLTMKSSSDMIGEMWIQGKYVDSMLSECLSVTRTRLDQLLSQSQHRIIQFQPNNPDRSPLLNASVWFPTNLLQNATKIRFVHCLTLKSNGKTGPMYVLREKQYRRSSLHKNVDSTNWRSFDVSVLFNSTNPTNNANLKNGQDKLDFGYFIAIMQIVGPVPSNGNGLPETTGEEEESDKFTPYLHMAYMDTKKSNTRQDQNKRNTKISSKLCDDTKDGTRGVVSQCCLRSLQVNFKEIGWHWIVAPKSMRMHYCEGYCSHPYGSSNAATSQAAFLTFLHGSRAAVGQLCCVPSTYHRRHVSIWTPRHGRTVVRSLEDLDAASCVCSY